ncbi:metalloprotease mig-17-like [Littorina saxatilis]|uniref:metalloprotease mig-17-like n=1 Tax=Littorina saxatilis TaxID=31220 RepID=UPI0038B447D3
MTSLSVSGMILVLLLLSLSDGVTIEKRSQPYSIELRVIVDSYAFNSWKGYVASSAAYSAKDAVTKSSLTNYIKSSVNDLNSIFSKLSKSGISMDARIVSIEFVTDTITSGSTGNAESKTCLKDFKDWLATKNYPRVDHTMLLTGLDLMTNGNRATTGVAYTGMMCDTEFSLTAVEALPTGAVTITMAHELGHSLTSEHDGDGNTCTTGSYIMKASSEPHSASNQNFRFSACSVAYFSTFLTGEKNTCLLQTTAGKVNEISLGQLYNPDQMCQMVEGPQSYVCRSFYGEGKRAYSEICLNVMCAKPGGSYCRSISSADGFVCGKGKRCSLGDCVAVSSTDSGTDTCPLGDNPLPQSNLNGQKCSQAIASKPSHCYQTYNQRVCCQSCQAAKSAKEDCVYGDRASWCSDLQNYECYVNSEVCCATCVKSKTAVAGCEFGDKASWCATMDVRNCPLNSQVCCEKCK